MNFVYVSPAFPKNFYNFCDRLKNMGVTVLAIGDTPYHELSEELKNAVDDYYQVYSMEDYNEMVKAMGYFIFNYGHIDWLESNNEYWLEQDARLRTDFNIITGIHTTHIEDIKCKYTNSNYSYANERLPTRILSTIPAAGTPLDPSTDTSITVLAEYDCLVYYVAIDVDDNENFEKNNFGKTIKIQFADADGIIEGIIGKDFIEKNNGGNIQIVYNQSKSKNDNVKNWNLAKEKKIGYFPKDKVFEGDDKSYYIDGKIWINNELIKEDNFLYGGGYINCDF